MNVLQIKHAVRTRDGFRCTKCGMSNDEHKRLYGRVLDVHRQVPGSAYAIDGCVTLCRPCHGPEPRSRYGTSGKLAVDLLAEIAIAVEIQATKLSVLRGRRVSKSEVVVGILRDALSDEIEEINQFRLSLASQTPVDHPAK